MASDFASVDARPAAPQTGDLIDGFRLGTQVGEGGTALLFHVTAEGREDPGFPMLMKIPRVGAWQPAESILGFEMEAMILPMLSGHHIPRFVAAGDLATVPYLTMEWIEGISLLEVAREAPLPVERVVAIGAALADAVHALHQQDVIHHDFKPANVMLRGDGSAVLLDLGFAHHAHLPDLLSEERRFLAGSAPYVSPEQLGGSRDDPRGDLFALGVVIYQLATNRLPFGAPDSQQAMRNRLWAAVIPPRARVPGLPPWLQEVILRCLEPDPAVRYQSAAHIAFDLRHPDQVPLTPRAARVERPGFVTQFKLWMRSREDRRPMPAKPRVLLERAPVIMVAIDTSHPEDPRHAALQWTTRQMASLNLEFRLICLSVVRPASLEEARHVETSPSGMQLIHKVRLKNWIEPMGLPAERVTLHVIESITPAESILEFAAANHVNLIVIGAPAPGDATMAWWRSTASSVTANAQCSVHVVRVGVLHGAAAPADAAGTGG